MRLICFLIFNVAIGIIGCEKDPNTNAIADFEYPTDSEYHVGDTIVFKNTSENATKFQWVFGDGDTSLVMEPTHVYVKGGTYTVKLVAANDKSKDSTFKTLSVKIMCVNRIYANQYTKLLSDSILSVIKDLFNKNSMSTDNLQFSTYSRDFKSYTHISGNYYFNGLIVFLNMPNFHFDKNGVFVRQSGLPDVPPDLDTIPNYSAEDASGILIHYFINDILLVREFVNLDNACINAQLVYFDLKAFVGNTHQYTLGWKLNFNNMERPVAYIDAKTNKYIYYDNGIRY